MVGVKVNSTTIDVSYSSDAGSGSVSSALYRDAWGGIDVDKTSVAASERLATCYDSFSGVYSLPESFQNGICDVIDEALRAANDARIVPN